MTPAQTSALSDFLQSLAETPWFVHCGEPDATVIVASDLVAAWDRWHSEMLAVWLAETHELERLAIGELGEAGVDTIFVAVSQAVDDNVRAGMEQYFERRPANSEAAVTNTDRGLWPEWLDSVKRDLCWAAVEAVLLRSGFFTNLLRHYHAGRWVCAWEHPDRSGRMVVL